MNQQDKEVHYQHNQAVWEQQAHTQLKIKELQEHRLWLLLDAAVIMPTCEANKEIIARKLAEASAVTTIIKKLIPSYVDK